MEVLMYQTKVITSKRQTDFENRVARFLNSVSESYGTIHSIHYSAGWNGNEVVYTAMILFREEDSYEG